MSGLVYLQAKRVGTDEPMGDVMGPMSERDAEKVTRGMLINMRDDCYVDEWLDELEDDQ
jgi:hypothetical protein